jgi:hypothetical protein
VLDAPAQGDSDVARPSAAEGVAACDALHETTMTTRNAQAGAEVGESLDRQFTGR